MAEEGDGQSMLIGIALHKGIDVGSIAYHWALVIHPQTYDAALVRTYELVNRDDNGRPTAWKTLFRQRPLNGSTKLVGVVHVGRVSASESDLDEFLGAFGPERDDYPTGGRGWTSIGWVLRCIRYLEMSDLLPLQHTDDEIFVRVLQLGEQMDEMLSRGEGAAILRTNL
ncbi:hypothetical protein OE88DRAFT_1736389 [Heliocybe sulcata]|uniref:Uncharacterized protein n=1 Tax=Heliocybe sulcata TaxID=5364 RepID=A0A5C3N8H1_9AGAM|nr:hypothetical protein OE88DRAFT_1736389 [Heliocybe sulcata]